MFESRVALSVSDWTADSPQMEADMDLIMISLKIAEARASPLLLVLLALMVVVVGCGAESSQFYSHFTLGCVKWLLMWL
ncbi:hypothetical protein RRG08_003911 [Elysia crispata]|uniref:Uncharacterized protein n=1 Tax=Elysia crispata TaxID=231223 RepID=A0AAE1D539_9GAST|nr:hypothetical protein RRG08_003911 [Elysia crispata]